MGGAAARLHGLARWLAHYGHEVTVVTPFPNYPSGIIPAKYRRKFRVNEEMDGVKLCRSWIYASPKRSSWRRILNYLSFTATAAINGLAIGKNFDFVLASSPPLFIGLSGWVIARLHRIPWVFDIRDIWPEVAVEAGEFPPDGLITRLTNWLARFLYQKADHITPVTEYKFKKLMNSGVPAHKMSVVTNGVDLDMVAQAEIEDLRQELSIEADQFVVLYAGLLGIAQGVDIAIRAAERLRERANIHFVIVGDGVKRAELLEQAQTLGLTNVTMLPRQPREKIPSFLKMADVCLVPLVNEQINDAVPSKLLEAWAYQRAVILAAGGESADIVRSCVGGLVIEPGNDAQLAEAVAAMQSQPLQLKQYAQNGYELVSRCYDRRILAEQMAGVLMNRANPNSNHVSVNLSEKIN